MFKKMYLLYLLPSNGCHCLVPYPPFHVFLWQKLDPVHNGSVKLFIENHKDSPSSALTTSSDAYNFKHRRSSSKWNEDISQAGSSTSETIQAGEFISGLSSMSNLPIV